MAHPHTARFFRANAPQPGDWAIPPGLTPDGQLAARAIYNLLRQEGALWTGGQQVFYAPDDWKRRGEEYGLDSQLIVVHDGGNHAKYFNYDYLCYPCIERMEKALEPFGVYAQQATSWYSSIRRGG